MLPTLLNTTELLTDKAHPENPQLGTRPFVDELTPILLVTEPQEIGSLTTSSPYLFKAPIFPHSRLTEALPRGWMAALETDDATRHQPCKRGETAWGQ